MVESQFVFEKKVPNSIIWFCGVDGSDGAEAAFSMVKKDLYREHKDFVSVGHIRDISKTYLSWHFKPEYIQETYTTKLLDIGKEGEFLMIDR